MNPCELRSQPRLDYTAFPVGRRRVASPLRLGDAPAAPYGDLAPRVSRALAASNSRIVFAKS
jgi:hypothetical protein